MSISGASKVKLFFSKFTAFVSFLFCVITMYTIYMNWNVAVKYEFAISLLSLLASLIVSLIEITQSTKALELELSDIEEPGRSGLFSELIKRKEDK